MNHKFKSIIDRLCSYTKRSDMRHKLAAGLFYTRKGMLSIGCNSSRSYVRRSLVATLHAEVAALHQFSKQYPRLKTRGLKLIVVRFSSSGMLGFSLPCENCRTMIRQFGIRKIYYINEGGELVCESIDQLKSCNNILTDRWFLTVTSDPSCLLRKINDTLKRFNG